jgi:hypothetical protein
MKEALVLSAMLLLVSAPRSASAHCDTLDGPVVRAAQKALATGKVSPVLAWVQSKDEPEIKTAFDQTLAVRKLGAEAKALADRYFFETLVRVHRAGEGAPYTGLKPAGGVQDPALVAADKAIDTGKHEPVARLLGEAVRAGLHERFAPLRALPGPGDDIAKGRQWVAAYVAYVHYVVGVHQAAAGKTGEHEVSAAVPAAHHDE